MKKIICYILIFIIIMSPVSVYASSAAGTLEVSGSIAAGGLSGGIDQKMFAVAMTLMVMSALGMQVKLTEQAKAAGETAQTYIENMYAKWVGGTSATELTESQREELKKRWKVISTGGSDNQGDSNNKVNKNGKIYLAAGALALIQKFLNWMHNNNNIYEDQNPGINLINGTYFGEVCNVYSNGTLYECRTRYWASNHYVYIPSAWIVENAAGGKYKLFAYQNRQFESYYDIYNYYGSSGTYSRYGFVICEMQNLIDSVPNGVAIVNDLGYASVEAYLRAKQGLWDESQGDNDPENNHVDGEYSSSQLDNPNGGYTILDPALFEQLLNNVSAGTQAQLSIEDYIKAIMDQLNRQSNPEAVPATETVPVVNPTDLSPQPQPLPDPEPDPVPGTFPSDEPAPGDNDPPEDAEPTENPEPAPPDVAVPKMMIPLDEYFPFCIPFDVYHLLQKLSADPVAPSYTIGFTVYGTEVNYTISLDAFSNAMVIVRRMELFVCVIGLAIASRKIFTR